MANMHVAPLNTRMNHSAQSSSDMSDSTLVNTSMSQASSTNLTPPATPDDDADVANLQYPQPVFHNFLRTIYPYRSDQDCSDDTVTLDLNAGDLVMVHSVHVNGWADGTLLVNGGRGWLPTNYCENYDEECMRGLLQALLRFWSLLQTGVSWDDPIFEEQNFLKPVVAGVRQLLVI